MIKWSRGDRREFHISSSRVHVSSPITTASCIKVLPCTCQKPDRDHFLGLDTTQYSVNGPDCWASVTRVTEVPRTNVLGTPALHQAQCGASVADGDLRPPQLITDGDLMSPRLRGAGWDKM